ncbi:hypothetical protein V496_04574 [Pseudogymnoascus sp. VKM F-4515 (FW-2607)]|nr:hypothetical protein V496_04574 [Pseudogymnoascus sp. VKM F-4515 (FW-2607)]KFY95706.1 hypothetical protein V498_03184 [Pseudogymnoascus sp. VKM F-4517 (FW-2822)]
MLNSPMMELRKCADALLRSQASPLTQFLAPPTATRWATSSLRLSQRAFSSSTRRYIPDSNQTNPTPAPTNANRGTQKSPDAQASSPSWAAGARSSSRIIPSKSSESDDADSWDSGISSNSVAQDLLTGFNAGRKERGPNSPLNQRKSLNLDRMLAPKVSNSDLKDVISNLTTSVTAPVPPKPALRLNARTGRSVVVAGGVDVGRSFNLLGMSCARNKVKVDFNRQKFHERGGLKRKRLKRERWQRRFMAGFKATVSRVKEMKRQGW